MWCVGDTSLRELQSSHVAKILPKLTGRRKKILHFLTSDLVISRTKQWKRNRKRIFYKTDLPPISLLFWKQKDTRVSTKFLSSAMKQPSEFHWCSVLSGVLNYLQNFSYTHRAEKIVLVSIMPLFFSFIINKQGISAFMQNGKTLLKIFHVHCILVDNYLENQVLPVVYKVLTFIKVL